jgi:hypothetical protein
MQGLSGGSTSPTWLIFQVESDMMELNSWFSPLDWSNVLDPILAYVEFLPVYLYA